MTTCLPSLIIGGGVSGLVCAYALRNAGIDARVVEASPRAGGVISTERQEGFLLEGGPQSFTATPAILQLCRDVDIDTQLTAANAKAARFIVVNGSLKRLPFSPVPFLFSSLFDTATKSSLVRDLFGHSSPPLEDETVASFVRRKFSSQLLERLVAPFVSGIYAGDPEQLSLRSALPQVYEAERSAGSVIRGLKQRTKANSDTDTNASKGSGLMNFHDGTNTLVRALAEKLGPALACNVEVQEIRRVRHDAAGNDRYEVTASNNGHNQVLDAQHCILATPSDVAARLLRSVDPAFQTPLDIPYAPVAVVFSGYERRHVGHPLAGFGFLAPRASKLLVLGTVWNSSLFVGRAPKGCVLLTSFIGGATDPQAVNLSAEEIIETVHAELEPLLSISSKPIFSKVQFYDHGIPQYNLGHSERIARLDELQSKFPNLWLTGNYLRGPSVGACVEHALNIAQRVRKRMSA